MNMTATIVSALMLAGLYGMVIAGVYECLVPRAKPTEEEEGMGRLQEVRNKPS
jgi:hypothetical protein